MAKAEMKKSAGGKGKAGNKKTEELMMNRMVSQLGIKWYAPKDAKWVGDPPNDLIPWLEQEAIRVSKDPKAPIEDLEPLKELLGDARIVGLGEATHGTADFFNLKHRLVKFLVTKMGFTAVTFEAFPSECLVVNEYIQTGKGDPKAAVRMIYGGGFPWDTKEVLEMVKWLKKHNETAKRKVGFYGFDALTGPGPALGLVDYLARVDESLASKAEEVLFHFSTGMRGIGRFRQLSPDERKRFRDGIDSLIADLEARKDELASRASERDWAIARHLVHVIKQGADQEPSSDPRAGIAVRDRLMAENARLLLDLEGPAGKIICWAHNVHVFRDEFFEGVPAQGVHLNEWLGKDYVVVGFGAGEGTFRAHDLGPEGGGRVREFTLPAIKRGSFDGALNEFDVEAFIADLRAAPKTVKSWLSQPMPARNQGGGYAEDPSTPAALIHVAPAKAFDLVAFIRNTKAAKAIREAKAPTGTSSPAELKKPSNLTFKRRDKEGTPKDWVVFLGGDLMGYKLSISDEGELALQGRPKPWSGQAAILQQFDAADFKGKKLRLHAVASSTATGFGNLAELTLDVGHADPAQQMGPPLVSEFVKIEPGRSSSYDLMADVPQEAGKISISFRLYGHGKAKIRGLSVKKD